MSITWILGYKDEYEIHVRECSFEDVTEIDTILELQKIDSDYSII